MMQSTPRKLTLFDGMVLVAALAVGLALIRLVFHPTSGLRYPWRAAWAAFCAIVAFLMPGTVAWMVLRLRRARPPYRRLGASREWSPPAPHFRQRPVRLSASSLSIGDVSMVARLDSRTADPARRVAEWAVCRGRGLADPGAGRSAAPRADLDRPAWAARSDSPGSRLVSRVTAF